MGRPCIAGELSLPDRSIDWRCKYCMRLRQDPTLFVRESGILRLDTILAPQKSKEQIESFSFFQPRQGRPYRELTAAFLPSSLTRNHSFALVFSTYPPVSVSGTVAVYIILGGFLGSALYQISSSALHFVQSFGGQVPSRRDLSSVASCGARSEGGFSLRLESGMTLAGGFSYRHSLRPERQIQ